MALVRLKWLLAFTFALVVMLCIIIQLNPGFLTRYEELSALNLHLNYAPKPLFSASDEFKHHIADNIQSILNAGSNAVTESLDFVNTQLYGAEEEEEYKPKIAYVFAGSARSFVCPRVHWSIKSHLIDALGGDPHVFVRLSLEDNVNVKTGLGVLKNLDYDQQEVLNVMKVLNPKKIEFFSFSNQSIEMQELYPEPIHKVFRENDLRRYSMFFHRCMAYRMVQEYEQKNYMKFDWVVLVRVDAAWLEPVLPIGAYYPDRVWVTETGYDVFNDQFMLIPRQFSDYLYDLNTKVNKDVYCLGGPDVEQWKCKASELTARGVDAESAKQTLAHCCPDMHGNNVMGMSEAIHKRHLRHGQIPISIARFPVFLTRRYIADNQVVCHPECFRIYALNYKEYIFQSGNMSHVYPYMSTPMWPDTRGVGISARDRTLCYYYTRSDMYPWKPISAASPQLASAQYHIDYSKPLTHPSQRLHPSILLSPKYTEAWRIHPTWNTEGCLTFSYETKDLHWERCHDHIRMKKTRFDSRQMFYLYVVPTQPKAILTENAGYHAPVRFPQSTYGNTANVTRVMVVDGEAKIWDFQGHIYCLTAASLRSKARVYMEKCSKDEREPRQLFTTVRTMMDGTGPQSTVGQLQLVNAPSLCVSRTENAPADHKLQKFERERFPDSDNLMLKDCDLITQYHHVSFEFELMKS